MIKFSMFKNVLFKTKSTYALSLIPTNVTITDNDNVLFKKNEKLHNNNKSILTEALSKLQKMKRREIIKNCEFLIKDVNQTNFLDQDENKILSKIRYYQGEAYYCGCSVHLSRAEEKEKAMWCISEALRLDPENKEAKDLLFSIRVTQGDPTLTNVIYDDRETVGEDDEEFFEAERKKLNL